MSRKPYNAPATELPDPFNGLTYEQYIGIRALPNAVIWSGEGRGFTIEPLHRGYAFQSTVTLYLVEDGSVRRVAYDRSKFDYGKLQPQGALSGSRLFRASAFSGTPRRADSGKSPFSRR